MQGQRRSVPSLDKELPSVKRKLALVFRMYTTFYKDICLQPLCINRIKSAIKDYPHHLGRLGYESCTSSLYCVILFANLQRYPHQTRHTFNNLLSRKKNCTTLRLSQNIPEPACPPILNFLQVSHCTSRLLKCSRI